MQSHSELQRVGNVPWNGKKTVKKLSLRHYNLKFIYSEKATKFCKISTLLLTVTIKDKSKVDILQNFVAFSEYMNFKLTCVICPPKYRIFPTDLLPMRWSDGWSPNIRSFLKTSDALNPHGTWLLTFSNFHQKRLSSFDEQQKFIWALQC